eukprot:symbB.v1.2.037497.t1/scaffold5556.1/size26356/2
MKAKQRKGGWVILATALLVSRLVVSPCRSFCSQKPSQRHSLGRLAAPNKESARDEVDALTLARRQLKLALDQQASAQKQVDRANVQVDTADVHLQTAREDFRKAKETGDEEKVEKAKEEVKEAEEKVEKAKEEVKEAKEEVKEAEEKVEKAKEEVKEAEEKVEKAKEEVKEAEEKVEKAKEEVKEAKEEVKEAEEKVEKAKEEVKEAEEKVAKAEEKLDEKATQEKAPAVQLHQRVLAALCSEADKCKCIGKDKEYHWEDTPLCDAEALLVWSNKSVISEGRDSDQLIAHFNLRANQTSFTKQSNESRLPIIWEAAGAGKSTFLDPQTPLALRMLFGALRCMGGVPQGCGLHKFSDVGTRYQEANIPQLNPFQAVDILHKWFPAERAERGKRTVIITADELRKVSDAEMRGRDERNSPEEEVRRQLSALLDDSEYKEVFLIVSALSKNWREENLVQTYSGRSALFVKLGPLSQEQTLAVLNDQLKDQWMAAIVGSGGHMAEEKSHIPQTKDLWLCRLATAFAIDDKQHGSKSFAQHPPIFSLNGQCLDEANALALFKEQLPEVQTLLELGTLMLENSASCFKLDVPPWAPALWLSEPSKFSIDSKRYPLIAKMLEIFALGGEDSVIKPSQRGERLTASMVALALMQLKERPDFVRAILPEVPEEKWMCLSNRAKAKVSVTVKLPIDVDPENGQGFNEWVRRQMECQHSDEVIIVLTPDGYEAVDFYVFLPVDQYKIGCQTKIWTSADKTQQLEQARGNALAGRAKQRKRGWVILATALLVSRLVVSPCRSFCSQKPSQRHRPTKNQASRGCSNA